jgi:hypothetical protein
MWTVPMKPLPMTAVLMSLRRAMAIGLSSGAGGLRDARPIRFGNQSIRLDGWPHAGGP